MKTISKVIAYTIFIIIIYFSVIIFVPNILYPYIGNGEAIDNGIEQTGKSAGRCDYFINDLSYCSTVYSNYSTWSEMITNGKFAGSKTRRLKVLKQSRINQLKRIQLRQSLSIPIKYIFEK